MRRIDARGLVLAPGFIDLHWHGRDPASDRYEILDGVTSSLELEIGTADVNGWYEARRGRSILHHGVSAGHPPVRMEVLGDSGDFLPADKAAFGAANDEQIARIKMRLEQEIAKGAVAMGLGVQYTPGASNWEIIEVFRLAARHGLVCHVHVRASSSSIGDNVRIQALGEAIAAAAVTGASLHVVHINSLSLGSIGKTLEMIDGARARGLDVTTEAYPYTAGATRIESASYDGWENRPDEEFAKLQWFKTGERLTRESFFRYRKERGLVIYHANTEEGVRAAVVHPLSMIASDGFDITPNGHPRSAGTFSKILRQYVREEKALPLAEAIAKMTIMPARTLERRVPQMKRKGRVQAGADADLVIFDAAVIRDRSTFEKPAQESEGVRYAMVMGTLVVTEGKIVDGVFPGQALRGPVK
ncbi:MAG: amidohydrolase family protein [Bryobacteraceae bacterium]